MDAFEIRGGHSLRGETQVYGAKNAALPILAATVMVEGMCRMEGVPDLEDVRVMMQILSSLGAHVVRDGDVVLVDASAIQHTNVPSDLMRKMRSGMCCKVLVA